MRNNFKKVIKEGRVTRKEYWLFILISFVIFFILSLVEKPRILGIGYLRLIYALVIAVPTILISLNRLNDINKSRWWFILNVIPFIGPLCFLILMSMKSKCR